MTTQPTTTPLTPTVQANPDLTPISARYDCVLQPTGQDDRTAIVGVLPNGRPVAMFIDPSKLPDLVDELRDPAWDEDDERHPAPAVSSGSGGSRAQDGAQ